MKIEQLLVQHFYKSGEVTLQGMGTFTLSPDFVMPKDTDKDAEIPDNAILFQYNSRATADVALISFIVQQTGKMKPLAAADLDSYLVLGKQFLNIGKPFKIEGMGMLSKNQQGNLEFSKGHSFHSKQDTLPPALLKEKTENPEISFASETKPVAGNKKGLLIAIAIIGIGLMATAAWYFFIKKNNNNVNMATVTANADTVKTVTTIADSIITNPVNAIPATDLYNFKVVFMITTDSAAAVKRMDVLTKRGHKVIMYKKDSLSYKLAEPFTLPLADTTRIKDSLNSFYYSGRAFIELQ
jgi:hypothetical protein